MPDGSIPCPICGQYDSLHLKSCYRYPFGSDKEVFVVGWECPVCHRGLSPDATVCHHGQDPKGLIAPVGSSKTINIENQWDSFSWQEQE